MKWGNLVAVESGLLPTLFFFCQLHHLRSFLLSVKMRFAGEKIVFPMALYYVEVVHRRRLQPTSAHAAKVLGSLFASIGRPVIGYLPMGLSPPHDRSGSARPGCRTDSARAYDRKRAQPHRNGRGAIGIAR